MRIPVFAVIALLAAMPALAGNLDPGPEIITPSPPSPSHDGLNCISAQDATVNASLGLSNGHPDQGPCLEVPPPDSANLAGFAFPLASCGDGFVKYVDIQFNIADAGDEWQLYLWRDLAGLPNDACGMECAVAVGNPIQILNDGPTWETYNWAPEGCPCQTFGAERLWVGLIYVQLFSGLPDWFLGRQEGPIGLFDMGYANVWGQHGAWEDLASFGFDYGNRWGVQYSVSTDCSATTSIPTESEGMSESTWGALRAYYR